MYNPDTILAYLLNLGDTAGEVHRSLVMLKVFPTETCPIQKVLETAFPGARVLVGNRSMNADLKGRSAAMELRMGNSMELPNGVIDFIAKWDRGEYPMMDHAKAHGENLSKVHRTYKYKGNAS